MNGGSSSRAPSLLISPLPWNFPAPCPSPEMQRGVVLMQSRSERQGQRNMLGPAAGAPSVTLPRMLLEVVWVPFTPWVAMTARRLSPSTRSLYFSFPLCSSMWMTARDTSGMLHPPPALRDTEGSETPQCVRPTHLAAWETTVKPQWLRAGGVTACVCGLDHPISGVTVRGSAKAGSACVLPQSAGRRGRQESSRSSGSHALFHHQFYEREKLNRQNGEAVPRSRLNLPTPQGCGQKRRNRAPPAASAALTRPLPGSAA